MQYNLVRNGTLRGITALSALMFRNFGKQIVVQRVRLDEAHLHLEIVKSFKRLMVWGEKKKEKEKEKKREENKEEEEEKNTQKD